MKEKATASAPCIPPEVSYTSRNGEERKAIYEHPFAVRFTHWLNAIALVVMAGSGLRIYLAFPAFGDKVPPHDFFRFPESLSLGGWLAGALQWHFTFMWLFVGAGILYVCYELITGNWRQALFMPRDVRGVWPMFRHYFLFGPKPEQTETYNSLQKLAYSGTLLLGVLSTLTGLILYKSAQLSFLVPLLGGYRSVRILHFIALVGFAAFVPGHLVMVVVHGWNNFQSMLTGWNFKPAYAVSTLPASTAGDRELKVVEVEATEPEGTHHKESERKQTDAGPIENGRPQKNAAPEDKSKDEPSSTES
jgi:Ni/Fe-hydrogenase b-type cytochrome subunit